MLLLLFIVHGFAIFKPKSVFNIPHIIRTVIFFSEWHLWSCNFTSGFWETLPYQNQQGKWDRQFITMDSSPRNGATESERVFQWWFDSNSHRTPAEHAWHANWQSLHFLICYLFHMLALYMQSLSTGALSNAGIPCTPIESWFYTMCMSFLEQAPPHS